MFPDQDIFKHGFRPGVLASAGAFFNIKHGGNLLVRKSFNCIKVKHGAVTYWQHSDTFHHFLSLDDGGNAFLANLNTVGVNEVHTFIEALVLFQIVDAGMNNNSPDPSFQCSTVLKRM